MVNFPVDGDAGRGKRRAKMAAKKNKRHTHTHTQKKKTKINVGLWRPSWLFGSTNEEDKKMMILIKKKQDIGTKKRKEQDGGDKTMQRKWKENKKKQRPTLGFTTGSVRWLSSAKVALVDAQCRRWTRPAPPFAAAPLDDGEWRENGEKRSLIGRQRRRPSASFAYLSGLCGVHGNPWKWILLKKKTLYCVHVRLGLLGFT